MTKKEFILEGYWSGYRGEPKLCHVEKTKHPEYFKDLNSILFTDNTYLNFKLRPKLPKEKIKENPSYYSLIRQCLRENQFNVAKLKD